MHQGVRLWCCGAKVLGTMLAVIVMMSFQRSDIRKGGRYLLWKRTTELLEVLVRSMVTTTLQSSTVFGRKWQILGHTDIILHVH